MYKRVLLKLSGEALAAPDFPFSTEVLESIGKQVKQINEMGVGVGIVVGGGNICRGRIFEDLGFDRVKADYAGMLATVINAVMFSAELNRLGVKSVAMSAVTAQNVMDFDADEANRLIEEGNVVVFGGGYGKPYYSTDTGSAQRAKDIHADVILMATGRRPNVEGLNLEAAGLALAAPGSLAVNGLPVDDNFRCIGATSIYAIGDVNGRQMLAHAAEMQAVRAVNHILGRKDGIRFDIMPSAIFTEPEAACVGLSEDALKALAVSGSPADSRLPVDYRCRKAFWRANGKALAMGETEGMLKLLSAGDDDHIIGCHAYGAHAADIVQEVTALMCRNTTVEQLRDMVHIHPTLSEILRSAAEQL